MAYQGVCGILAVFFLVAGLGLYGSFFRYHMPDSAAFELLPVGPNGAYWMAFAGSALVAWGGCLIGAARRPESAPWIATASAWGLALSGAYRMVAWVVGDYAAVGNLLRTEAAVLLSLALALVWLKPRVASEPKSG